MAEISEAELNARLNAIFQQSPAKPYVAYVAPRVARDMRKLMAQTDAEDLWRARGANWRRVKREGSKAAKRTH